MVEHWTGSQKVKGQARHAADANYCRRRARHHAEEGQKYPQKWTDDSRIVFDEGLWVK